MFRFKSHQWKTKSMKGKCKLDYQLPLFGLKFKVSSFISFMAWTGMTFCVLMILVSLALLTIPTDVKPSLPGLRYEQYLPLFHTMYGLEAVLMAMALPLLPM